MNGYTKCGVCMTAKLFQSCLTLCNPKDCSLQAPLSMGFSKQEDWNGLSCPPPGDLRDPGIEPASPSTPAMQADSLLLSHLESLKMWYIYTMEYYS